MGLFASRVSSASDARHLDPRLPSSLFFTETLHRVGGLRLLPQRSTPTGILPSCDRLMGRLGADLSIHGRLTTSRGGVASEMELLPTSGGSSGAEASNLGYFTGSLVAEAVAYPRWDGLMSGDIRRTVSKHPKRLASPLVRDTLPVLTVRLMCGPHTHSEVLSLGAALWKKLRSYQLVADYLKRPYEP